LDSHFAFNIHPRHFGIRQPFKGLGPIQKGTSCGRRQRHCSDIGWLADCFNFLGKQFGKALKAISFEGAISRERVPVENKLK